MERVNKRFGVTIGRVDMKILLLYALANRPIRDTAINYTQLTRGNLKTLIQLQYKLARAGFLEKTNPDQARPPYQITARGRAFLDYYELTARRFRLPKSMQAIINGSDNPRRPK